LTANKIKKHRKMQRNTLTTSSPYYKLTTERKRNHPKDRYEEQFLAQPIEQALQA
jgi:hypothetical protein